MTTQDKWFAAAVFCLFAGFILVATHDYQDNIKLGNAQSVLGYVLGIAGTLFSFYKAKGKAS